MPSSPPLALAVLLIVSGAARAADQLAPDRPLDASSRAMVEESGSSRADPAEGDRAFADSTRRADLSGLEPLGRNSMAPTLRVRLGRLSGLGRNPGAAPPAYGEVGIAVGSLAGLSIVPSYRVIMDDGPAASGAVDAQVLKLGARIRF
jgi:hypothetical protein